METYSRMENMLDVSCWEEDSDKEEYEERMEAGKKQNDGTSGNLLTHKLCDLHPHCTESA